MMVTIDSMRVMEVLSDATNTIAEGEVEQLLNMHDPEVTETRYFSVIEKKTAKLFEAACQLGAVLTSRTDLEGDLRPLVEARLRVGDGLPGGRRRARLHGGRRYAG